MLSRVSLPPLPPGMTIRHAEPADHKRAVSIRENVYAGLDYLDYYYPHYMAHPNMYCYIMEKHGQPVMFAFRLVVDDGQTVVAGGARIAVDFEGQRLSKLFLQHVNADVLCQRPSIKKIALTSFENEIWSSNLKLKPDVYTRLFIRQCISFRAKKEILLSFTTYPMIIRQMQEHVEEIWRPSLPETVEIMMKESNNKKLFPEHLFVARWEPFTIIPSNIEYMNELSTVFFSGNKLKGQLSVLSILSPVFAAEGVLRYDIELYGSAESSLLNHVCECLDYLHQIQDYGPEARVEVIFYFPMTTKRSFFDDLAKLGGWEPGALSTNTHYIGVSELVKEQHSNL